jgi:hypothetical protein
MSGGYLAYELLAGQASVLLAALVAFGLVAWLHHGARPGRTWRARLTVATGACDQGLAERLARPVMLPRQIDPDARRGHRPRAPSFTPSRNTAA